MRRILPVLLSTLLLPGCRLWPPGSPAPAPQPRTYPATTQHSDLPSPRPATAPAVPTYVGTPGPGATGDPKRELSRLGSPVMAKVNGQPIPLEQLLTPLLEAHGLGMAEMLVHNALVDHEAARLNLSATPAEIAAEHERSLEGILGQQVSPEQRQQVLDELLSRRGLTRSIWDATMRRNVLLRKMAEPQVKITEAMVQAEYARQFGEKAQVSHIQLPSVAEAEKIIELLKKGGDFAALARKYSVNEATVKEGGLLPPFTRDNASVPRALRDAAFALKEGQISGIVQVSSDFHVLRLEKKTPPAQEDYDKVKDPLRKALYQGRLEQIKLEILTELRRKADVEYVNPILRKAAGSVRIGS